MLPVRYPIHLDVQRAWVRVQRRIGAKLADLRETPVENDRNSFGEGRSQ